MSACNCDHDLVTSPADDECELLRQAGADLRPLFDPWGDLDVAERANLLKRAHDDLRHVFGVKRKTVLVFATDIEGDDEGAGYDEKTGYILLLVKDLLRPDPAPLVAGLAHEVRHAYQHDVVEGVITDPRASIWRDAFDAYDAEAKFNDLANALETDADDVRCDVCQGFDDAGS